MQGVLRERAKGLSNVEPSGISSSHRENFAGAAKTLWGVEITKWEWALWWQPLGRKKPLRHRSKQQTNEPKG